MLKRIYLQCIAVAVVVFVFANTVAYSVRDIATANAVEITAVEAMKPGDEEDFFGEAPLGDLDESSGSDESVSEESSASSGESSSVSSGEESGMSEGAAVLSASTDSSAASASSSNASSASSQKSEEPSASNVSSTNSKNSSSALVPPTTNSFVTPPASAEASKPAASTSSSSSKPAASSSKPAASTSSRPAASTSSRPAASTSSKPAASTSSRPAASTSSKPAASSSKPASSTPSKEPSSGETVRISVSGAAEEFDAYEAVCRVVEGEMGASFHVEALKAQALAVYSYLREQNGKGITPVLPMRDPSQKTRNAVSAVWGEAVYSGSSIAFTPYYASSAGYTNPCSDVWSGNYPYLKAVESAYDPSSSNKNVTTVIPEATMQSGLESVLGITLDESDPESWLEVVSTNDSGYVLSVRVTDASGGSHTTTGRKIRENVLGYKLKSHAFTVSYANGNFTFVTNGYGHGVGMSQTGANGYAVNEGWNYKQILSHYYPGTSVR